MRAILRRLCRLYCRVFTHARVRRVGIDGWWCPMCGLDMTHKVDKENVLLHATHATIDKYDD